MNLQDWTPLIGIEPNIVQKRPAMMATPGNVWRYLNTASRILQNYGLLDRLQKHTR